MLIAIDPGAMGGIAVYDEETRAVTLIPMPDTEADVCKAILDVKIQARAAANATPQRVFCYIEQVGGFTSSGGSQPGSAMFKFGRNVGFLHGVLAAMLIPVVEVTPQKWQKEFSLGTVKTAGGKTAWKNKIKAKGQQLYPHLADKIILKTSDALLILDYAIKQEGWRQSY